MRRRRRRRRSRCTNPLKWSSEFNQFRVCKIEKLEQDRKKKARIIWPLNICQLMRLKLEGIFGMGDKNKEFFLQDSLPVRYFSGKRA